MKWMCASKPTYLHSIWIYSLAMFSNAQRPNIIQSTEYGYVQQYATVTNCMDDFGMQAYFAKTYLYETTTASMYRL